MYETVERENEPAGLRAPPRDHADRFAVGQQRRAFDDDLLTVRKTIDDRDAVAVYRTQLDAAQARDIDLALPFDDRHRELPAAGVGAHHGGQRHHQVRRSGEWAAGVSGPERNGSDHPRPQPSVRVGDGDLDVEDPALPIGGRGDRGHAAVEGRRAEGLDGDADHGAGTDGLDHAVGDAEPGLDGAEIADDEADRPGGGQGADLDPPLEHDAARRRDQLTVAQRAQRQFDVRFGGGHPRLGRVE